MGGRWGFVQGRDVSVRSGPGPDPARSGLDPAPMWSGPEIDTFRAAALPSRPPPTNYRQTMIIPEVSFRHHL